MSLSLRNIFHIVGPQKPVGKRVFFNAEKVLLNICDQSLKIIA